MTGTKRSLEDTNSGNDDKKKKLILQLPLSDFPSTGAKKKDDDDTLFLLQLPSSTMDCKSYSSSNIIITNNDKKKTNNNDCRWITTNETRELIRVESSNAYVLVPPNKENQARLLRETDTYFLTTHKCNNDDPTLEQVSQQLPNTMEGLVESFAISPKQLQQILQQLPYIVKQQEDGMFSMCHPTNIQECSNAIVSTLLEECHDVNSTVSISSLLPQIQKRMSDDSHQSNSIILYTLRHLSTGNDDTNNIPILQKDFNDDCKNETIQLDIKKIARVAVMDLFQQKETWNWSELRMKWQQRIPTTIEVEQDWLHGIALNNKEDDEYQFLNEINLSLNLSKRMTQLFNCNPRFTIQNITPFLQRFSNATGNTIDNLISTYTNSHEDKQTGTKYYSKK